jgi:hypothetical protein
MGKKSEPDNFLGKLDGYVKSYAVIDIAGSKKSTYIEIYK